MNFKQEKTGPVAIITLAEETFEAAMVEDFSHHMAPIIEENTHVVFDLSHIRFLDSMACGALLTCHRKLKDKGGKMGICCPQKQVNTVFELMGFPQLFDVFNDRKEALRAYR